MASSTAVDEVAKKLQETTVSKDSEVSFAGKSLKLDNANDVEEIVQAIKDAECVKSLRLDGNTIGSEAAKAIAEVLKLRPEFERALWSDIFTGRVRSEIPPSLISLGDALIESGAKLKELDLSDNAFGPDGVKAIKKLLMSPVCYSLEVLKLNNNGLGIGGGKILSQALLECHKLSIAAGRPLALKVFISGRNRLENEGAIALSAVFKTLGSLEMIQMPQNGIHHPGITALADSFSFNKNLKVVNLNDNTCGTKGAAAIARVLPDMHSLVTLNLGDALIRNNGALAVATALKRGATNVEELVLSGSEIRLDGAMAIVEAISHRDNIKVLNLDGNQLGDGIEDIIEKMDAYGKRDVLGPFDENEEPDSEDDEEEEDDEGEEEGEEDEETADATERLALEIKGIGLSPDSKQLKEPSQSGVNDGEASEIAKTFLEAPSIEMFKQLPLKKRKFFLQTAVKENFGDPILIGNIFVKTTVAIAEDVEGLKTLSDAVLEETFKGNESDRKSVVNSILVHLGLLKGEEKVERHKNIKGPLIALEHVVSQDYFPKDVAGYFKAFMSRPDRILDGYRDQRHQLLQKLYQI
eukprot:gene7169-7975_t